MSVHARGTWHGVPRDVVVLDFVDRHRRRLAMRGVRGTSFLLDLADVTALRGGDALLLDDGGLVEIVAAPETLIEISAGPAAMVRIAWHLGNRHLAVQIVGAKLRVRRDHVVEAMVEGLGGRVRAVEAPFDPEGGAYAGSAHEHGDHHDRA